MCIRSHSLLIFLTCSRLGHTRSGSRRGKQNRTYTLVKFPPLDPICCLIVKDVLFDVIESLLSSVELSEEESSSAILQLFFLNFAASFVRLSCNLEERRRRSDITVVVATRVCNSTPQSIPVIQIKEFSMRLKLVYAISRNGTEPTRNI